ncbi:GHKL domain-containing protein [Lachnospiraceae bacterium C7]|nr:GHKL domain-containing protein [Lachnospiraceae bacterium C7]
MREKFIGNRKIFFMVLAIVIGICVVFFIRCLHDHISHDKCEVLWMFFMILPFLFMHYVDEKGIIYLGIPSEITAIILMWTPLKSHIGYCGKNMVLYYPIIYPCVVGFAYIIKLEINEYKQTLEELSNEKKMHQKEIHLRFKEQVLLYQEKERIVEEFYQKINHHNLIMEQLIKNGELEDVKAYLEEINNKMDYDEEFCKDCCNYAIKGILLLYSRKAKEEGCNLKVRAEVPKNLEINPTDVTYILANALENSINAAKERLRERITETDQLEELSEEYKQDNLVENIRVYISYDVEESELDIKIANGCSKNKKNLFTEDGIPISDRKDGGMGTITIRRVAEKYKGVANFNRYGETFLTRVQILC